MKIILSFFKKIFSKMFQFLSFLFGNLSFKYVPPKWAKEIPGNLKKGISSITGKIKSFKEKRPKLFLLLTAGPVALTVIIITVSIVFSLIPRPETISYNVDSPSVSQYGETIITDSLYVNFYSSAASLELIGKDISNNISVSPEVNGSWKWIDDKRIVFTPSEDWPIGQKYEVKMDKLIFPDHVYIKSYNFEFYTVSFSANIYNASYYIDPVNPDNKHFIATIKFKYPVNTEELEKNIKLYPVLDDDRDYSYTLNYNDYFTEAYIISEKLAIPHNDKSIELKVGKNIHAREGSKELAKDLTARITIPGLYNYIKIKSVTLAIVENEQNIMEQVIIFSSKGEAKHDEIISNLVVHELPKDRPVLPGISFSRDYRWGDLSEIGPEIMDLSRELSLDPIPSERDYSSLNSFKIKASPNRYVLVKLNAGTTFYGNYKLRRDYVKILKVPEFPKQLKILHEGSILSMSGDKILSMMAHDVEYVQFEIGRVIPDQLNHLVSQTYGNFQNPSFNNRYFNEDNIVEKYYETRTLAKLEPGEIQYFSFDFTKYLRLPTGEGSSTT